MKRYISIFLVFSIIFSFCVIPASAVVTDDTEITFEYFYNTLRAEYQKYGVDFAIENPNYDYTYTMGFLNQELGKAQSFCEGIHIEVQDTPTSSSQGVAVPASIPAYYSFSKNVNITSNSITAPGFVTITVYCSGQVDLQNAAVMSYNYGMSEGASLNLAENNTYVSAGILSTGKKVSIALQGSVKFSWTEPTTNSVFATNVYGPFFYEAIDPHDYLI